MYHEIKREFSFEAAHRLHLHKGKCQRIHGHSYKVQVHLARPNGTVAKEGMVVDFGELKGFQTLLDEYFDHQLLLYSGDPIVIALRDAIDRGIEQEVLCGLRVIGIIPTAENLAKYIYDMARVFVDSLSASILVTKVTIAETCTCEASYVAVPEYNAGGVRWR